jgi:acetyl esterase/lipase
MFSTATSSRLAALIASLCLALGGAAWAADPEPTHADISYGPHPHQLLDIYLPKGDGPFPVLIWCGRLWEPGVAVPPVKRMFQSGVAAVAVRTRVMKDGVADNIQPPISVCLLDARRALQYVRLHAAEWKLDPDRIAVGGSSQGALPALYVACDGEKADPKSADPVERVSTKVACVGAHRSQPSIDPRRMQEWVPGVEWGAPAFGCSFAESLKRRDELLPLIEKWSPENLLHKGGPAIYFENNWGLTQPEGVAKVDYLVHSPRWALGFQKIAQEHGVTCYVKYPDHPTEKFADLWEFLARQGK